jgi:hypothetical protein
VVGTNSEIAGFVLKSILTNLSLKSLQNGKAPTDKLFIIYECIKNLLPFTFYGRLNDIILNDILYSMESSVGKSGKGSTHYKGSEIYTMNDLVEYKMGNNWKIGTIVKVDYKKQEYSIETINNNNQSTEIITLSFLNENIRKHLSTNSLDNNTLAMNPETINTNNIDNFSILTLENSSTFQHAVDLQTTKKSQLSIVELLHQFDIVSGMVKLLFADQSSNNSNNLANSNSGNNSLAPTSNNPVSQSENVNPFDTSIFQTHFLPPLNIFEFSLSKVICAKHPSQFCKLVGLNEDFSCGKCKQSISCGGTGNSSRLCKYRWHCAECSTQYCTSCYSFDLSSDDYSEEHFHLRKLFSLSEVLKLASDLTRSFSLRGISSDEAIEEPKDFSNLPAWSNILLNYFGLDDHLKKSFSVERTLLEVKDNDRDFQEYFTFILASTLKLFENVRSFLIFFNSLLISLNVLGN